MKAFTIAAGVLFFLSLISIDSDTWIPFVVCCVCWLFLTVVAHRNGWMYDREEEDEFE